MKEYLRGESRTQSRLHCEIESSQTSVSPEIHCAPYWASLFREMIAFGSSIVLVRGPVFEIGVQPCLELESHLVEFHTPDPMSQAVVLAL